MLEAFILKKATNTKKIKKCQQQITQTATIS